jgi:hypothetical protein
VQAASDQPPTSLHISNTRGSSAGAVSLGRDVKEREAGGNSGAAVLGAGGRGLLPLRPASGAPRLRAADTTPHRLASSPEKLLVLPGTPESAIQSPEGVARAALDDFDDPDADGDATLEPQHSLRARKAVEASGIASRVKGNVSTPSPVQLHSQHRWSSMGAHGTSQGNVGSTGTVMQGREGGSS